MDISTRLKKLIYRLPIFNRVFLANSLVILIGAICGTIITRHFAMIGDFRLILLFSSLGILLTLLVNYWIIRTALQPLKELSQVVDKVREGQTELPESLPMHSDPEIHLLVVTINSLLERLETRARRLRALSERAINAQEEERKRIARALHDDTAQALSTLIISLERIETSLPEDIPESCKRLAKARQIAVQILEDLRKNIWGLRPSILDDLGLIPAIRWYARQNLEEAGIAVKFETATEIPRLASHLETTLFRVAQEAVNNIVHHSKAKTAVIRLREEQSRICLSVEDDGQGFDVIEIAGQAVSRKQLGILGIQERVSLVGGQVAIQSNPGIGTSILVEVPVHANGLGTSFDELIQSTETEMNK